MKYIFFLMFFCFGCSKTQDFVEKRHIKSAVAQGGQFQLANPIVEFENIFFQKENKIQLKLNHEGTQIFYTLDGSNPTKESTKYVEPFFLKNSSKIRVKAFHKKCLPSETVEQQFLKVSKKNPIKDIHILATLLNRYTANGLSSLIDRKKGSSNFRDGNWLGFQDTSIVILLELESGFSFEKIIVSLLEDVNSWIFLPKSISVFTSEDGKKFQKKGEVIPMQTNSETPSGFRFLEIEIVGNSKFVKVVLQNIPLIPDWHPGKGSPAWIFLDEILIQ